MCQAGGLNYIVHLSIAIGRECSATISERVPPSGASADLILWRACEFLVFRSRKEKSQFAAPERDASGAGAEASCCSPFELIGTPREMRPPTTPTRHFSLSSSALTDCCWYRPPHSHACTHTASDTYAHQLRIRAFARIRKEDRSFVTERLWDFFRWQPAANLALCYTMSTAMEVRTVPTLQKSWAWRGIFALYMV